MKKLKVTFQLRATGKKVKVEFPLKSPVTNPSINKVFDTKVHAFQKKNDATLYHYEPVETDVKIDAFCKNEKIDVKINSVYGNFDAPLKCKCGSKVYTANTGTCPECKKAKLWHIKTRNGGPDLMIETYKCPECDYEENEAID